MKKWNVALCCLMLASSQLALAQDKGAAKKPPLTKQEMAERSKAVNKKAAMCAQKARQDKLNKDSKEFHQFIGRCLAKK